jgi:hypothetical protein
MTIEVVIANLGGPTCFVESSDSTHMIGLGPGQNTRLRIWKGKSVRVFEDETPEQTLKQETEDPNVI